MAASGYTPISLYYSTTAAAAPTAGNLVNGELAINITDGKLYYKDNTNAVQLIASKAATAGTFSSVTITGGSINGTTVGASTPSTGAFTTRDAAVENARNWIDAKLSGKLDQKEPPPPHGR